MNLTPEETIEAYKKAHALVMLAKYVLTFVDNSRADTLNDMAENIQGDIDCVLSDQFYEVRQSVNSGAMG